MALRSLERASGQRAVHRALLHAHCRAHPSPRARRRAVHGVTRCANRANRQRCAFRHADRAHQLPYRPPCRPPRPPMCPSTVCVLSVPNRRAVLPSVMPTAMPSTVPSSVPRRAVHVLSTAPTSITTAVPTATQSTRVPTAAPAVVPSDGSPSCGGPWTNHSAPTQVRWTATPYSSSQRCALANSHSRVPSAHDSHAAPRSLPQV